MWGLGERGGLQLVAVLLLQHNSIAAAAQDLLVLCVAFAAAELQALSEAPAESSNGAAAGKKSGVAAKSTKEESQQQEATLGMTAKKATNFAEWYTQVSIVPVASQKTLISIGSPSLARAIACVFYLMLLV